MLDALQAPIRRLLKVPPEPEPPLGDPGSVRVFRAAPGFYRYRLTGWGLKQVGALVGLVLGLVFLGFFPSWLPETLPGPFRSVLEAITQSEEDWSPRGTVGYWLGIAEVLAIAGFLLQLPFSWLLVSLDYRYRWYVTTDRSLRIREGLWKVQERTMTFSNVQNIAIRQGPVQRLFGIADVKVQTAGGGGKESGEEQQGSAADNLHIGYFRGVANAAEIRDGILAHLRRARASGLGDPDEPPPAVETGTELPPDDDRAALEAAREVLRETRALVGTLRERRA